MFDIFRLRLKETTMPDLKITYQSSVVQLLCVLEQSKKTIQKLICSDKIIKNRIKISKKQNDLLCALISLYPLSKYQHDQ